MKSWDEVRTAFQVARMGTVSGAADVLGVHHATVIRHIDALEERLGTRLFQRHARGYTPTEAGEDLLRVASATDDQFSQLAGRLRGKGTEMSGDLVVTTLQGLGPWLVDMLSAFQQQHPDLMVQIVTGDRLFRMEYGEAHVAVRAGIAPEEPDNVVQKFLDLDFGAYASKDYVAAHGMPDFEGDLQGHRFVGPDRPESRAPYYVWLREHVAPQAVSFRCSDNSSTHAAINAGAGIGFVPVNEAQRDDTLIEVAPARPEWAAPLWLVTHVDLHRTPKVQAVLKHLKDGARDGLL